MTRRHATVNTTADWTDTPTIDADLVRRAEAILEDEGTPDDGWAIGVVVAENADGWHSDWSIITDTEMTILSAAVSCDGDDTIPEDDLWQMLDPGDLIAWLTAGDDNLICTDEIDIIQKFAA